MTARAQELAAHARRLRHAVGPIMDDIASALEAQAKAVEHWEYLAKDYQAKLATAEAALRKIAAWNPVQDTFSVIEIANAALAAPDGKERG